MDKEALHTPELVEQDDDMSTPELVYAYATAIYTLAMLPATGLTFYGYIPVPWFAVAVAVLSLLWTTATMIDGYRLERRVADDIEKINRQNSILWNELERDTGG